MRHRCRMAYKRFHASQAFRQCDDLQIFEELPVIICIFEYKRNHGSGTIRLFFLYLIAGILRQSGKIHPVRITALREPAGDPLRIFYMPVHPYTECPDPSYDQKAVPGCQDSSYGILQIIQTVRQDFLIYHDKT